MKREGKDPGVYDKRLNRDNKVYMYICYVFMYVCISALAEDYILSINSRLVLVPVAGAISSSVGN